MDDIATATESIANLTLGRQDSTGNTYRRTSTKNGDITTGHEHNIIGKGKESRDNDIVIADHPSAQVEGVNTDIGQFDKSICMPIDNPIVIGIHLFGEHQNFGKYDTIRDSQCIGQYLRLNRIISRF